MLFNVSILGFLAFYESELTSKVVNPLGKSNGLPVYGLFFQFFYTTTKECYIETHKYASDSSR
jgi:hypothetical protein